MKYTVLLMFFLSLGVSLNAQKIEILRSALSFYKNAEFASAIIEYEKLSSSKNGKLVMGVDGNINLATCYLYAGQANKAFQILSEYKDYARERSDFHLYYGKALFATGQYDAASIELNKHLSQFPEDKECSRLIQQLNAIETIVPQFEEFSVIRQNIPLLQPSISTTTWGDALGLVYIMNEPLSSNKGVLLGLDSMGQVQSNSSSDLPLPELEGQLISFTVDRSGTQAVLAIEDTSGVNTLLYASKQQDKNWMISKLPFTKDDYNYCDPSLSADGSLLYFSSNQPNGVGGYDIWRSSRLDSSWSTPLNVGTDINTEQHERWPFAHVSNDLFFASNGHSGYGGMDIYSVKPLGNGTSWSRAANLGKPLNSSFDDISIHLSDDGCRGFYLSNRTDTLDLYQFIIPSKKPFVVNTSIKPSFTSGLSQPYKGGMIASTMTSTEETSSDSTSSVVNEKTPDGEQITSSDEVTLIIRFHVVDGFGKAIENAALSLNNKFSGEKETFSSDNNGLIELKLDADQKFIIRVDKEGYKSTSLPVSTMGATETQTVVSDLLLKKIN